MTRNCLATIKHIGPVTLCLSTLLLAVQPGWATVINVSNPENALAGAGRTVTASDAGIGVSGLGNVAAVIDNLAAANDQDASFIFGSTANEALSITGFNTPNGFETLRFFVASGDTQRVATQISAYSSTASTTSLSPGSYTTSLGSFNEPVGGWSYTAFDPSNPTASGRGYFDLTVAAPAGTQSLLLTFTANTASTRIYEVQALVPEPASFVLAGLGAVGLCVVARRRKA